MNWQSFKPQRGSAARAFAAKASAIDGTISQAWAAMAQPSGILHEQKGAYVLGYFVAVFMHLAPCHGDGDIAGDPDVNATAPLLEGRDEAAIAQAGHANGEVFGGLRNGGTSRS